MKTTLEIPDAIFRRAKSVAAERGIPLREFVTEAVKDKLAANAKSVEEFRAGKEQAINALIGQAMKASRGKANPAQLTELLRKKLTA